MPDWLDLNVCTNRLHCMLQICCVGNIKRTDFKTIREINEKSLK